MKPGDKVMADGREHVCTDAGVSGAPDFGPPWRPSIVRTLALHSLFRRYAERDLSNLFGNDPEPRSFASEPWR